ncbi:2,3-dehydroadipyl-CoA hydratase [compost metagenome]
MQYLLRAVPSAYAMKMALTGEPISAQEALRIGLIVDLVPRDQLLSAAMSLAECIAANGPLAVQSIKRLALQTAHLTPRDFVTQAHLHWGLLRDSKDYAEGRVASVEQRAPKYTGA